MGFLKPYNGQKKKGQTDSGHSKAFLWGGGSPQLYYHDCSGRIPGHTTRAPAVGFELETNSFQFFAIANLDKTSL